jgi:hypothetical protein
VLNFLDTLEEFRDISLEDWNFRQVVKSNLEHLLEKQRIYWMQRERIKWATLGDENIKFFHINATIRHNKNSIMVFKDRNGIEKNNHDDKAQLLWEAFKERLGTSEFTQMHFDLNTLLSPSVGLQYLILPFQKEEIDSIVSNLPNEKSPGLDGFNTEFLKKCWPVIKEEFYGMCFDFFDHSLCIQSINGSYITLIPKVPNPEIVNDYRPISLVNSSIKLITKILANRLQNVILQLTHQNQYGFLKNRSIQDCLS